MPWQYMNQDRRPHPGKNHANSFTNLNTTILEAISEILQSNTSILIQENEFENGVCKMPAFPLGLEVLTS